MAVPAITEIGFRVLWQCGEAGDPDHIFCGEHHAASATCPNCAKPLLRFLSLDTSDERLGLGTLGVSRVPLYTCWTCNVAQGRFYYRLLDDAEIEILEYRKGGCETDFPYPDYPTYFLGSKAKLVPFTDEEQHCLHLMDEFPNQDEVWGALEEELGGELYGHQVGGTPWLQDPWGPESWACGCPVCGGDMLFLASIADDDCADPRGFLEEGYAQYVYALCPTCRVVGANQRTD
jgi:hypothetical protein